MLPEREPNDHEIYMRTIASAWFRNELNEVAAGYEWQSAAFFLTALADYAKNHPGFDSKYHTPRPMFFEDSLLRAARQMDVPQLMSELLFAQCNEGALDPLPALFRNHVSDVVEGIDISTLRKSSVYAEREPVQDEPVRGVVFDDLLAHLLQQSLNHINAKELREWQYTFDPVVIAQNITHKVLFSTVLRGKGNRKNYAVEGAVTPRIRFCPDGDFDVVWHVISSTVERIKPPTKPACRPVRRPLTMAYVLDEKTFTAEV